MSDLDVRSVPSPIPSRVPGARTSSTDAELADLLRACGRGDVAAFGRFYDATIATVFTWARLRYDDELLVAVAVRAVYALAWSGAAGYAGSGLSPRAWLLCHGNPGPRFNSLVRNLRETERLMTQLPDRQAS